MTQLVGNGLTSAMRARAHRARDVVSLMSLLGVARPWRVRLLRPTVERAVTLTADGLRLSAGYCPVDETVRPGIVLAHGASRQGRRQALMLVLATLLRARGYHVFSYDARCYGESDHPATANDAAGFDFSRDVSAAVDWLSGRPEVDETRVYVLGHSFGAGAAVAAAANDRRIAKLVLFGPPRRLRERFLNERAADRRQILARMQRDMNVPYELNEDVVCEMVNKRDIEAHAEQFASGGHPPTLLIDASRESEADRAFLQAVAARMGDRAEYWTASGTDHYLNTGRVGAWVVYHPACVLPFVEKVDGFLGGAGSGGPTVGHRGLRGGGGDG
ncbi:alpha/beta hydrolase [Phycisphaerales bacterium AB-hyl4]|uniref:Alpha/beta hydrolase n=1 Tax=Natronomicrosphaera hydrolytica TaxID=3242702 RepID=A0ABV4U8P7_9BACT